MKKPLKQMTRIGLLREITRLGRVIDGLKFDVKLAEEQLWIDHYDLEERLKRAWQFANSDEQRAAFFLSYSGNEPGDEPKEWSGLKRGACAVILTLHGHDPCDPDYAPNLSDEP